MPPDPRCAVSVYCSGAGGGVCLSPKVSCSSVPAPRELVSTGDPHNIMLIYLTFFTTYATLPGGVPRGTVARYGFRRYFKVPLWGPAWYVGVGRWALRHGVRRKARPGGGGGRHPKPTARRAGRGHGRGLGAGNIPLTTCRLSTPPFQARNAQPQEHRRPLFFIIDDGRRHTMCTYTDLAGGPWRPPRLPHWTAAGFLFKGIGSVVAVPVGTAARTRSSFCSSASKR